MDYFIELIKEWGYIAVLLGSMVEGESVILTASFLAHEGYFSLKKIMIIAFFGTLFADQALYQLGYHYGPQFLERFPNTKHRVTRAFDLLHRWDLWFILVFRFIYGIRTISPIVIGTAGVKPWRFIPLNILAALIWTVVSCSAGYLLGDLVEKIILNMDVIQRYFLLILVALIAMGAGVYCWIKGRASKNIKSDSLINR